MVFFFKSLFIYFWLHEVLVTACGPLVAVRGLLFIAVHGLLTAVASLGVEHRLQVKGLQ